MFVIEEEFKRVKTRAGDREVFVFEREIQHHKLLGLGPHSIQYHAVADNIPSSISFVHFSQIDALYEGLIDRPPIAVSKLDPSFQFIGERKKTANPVEECEAQWDRKFRCANTFDQTMKAKGAEFLGHASADHGNFYNRIINRHNNSLSLGPGASTGKWSAPGLF